MNMVSDNVDNTISLETKGTTTQKILVAILLLVPIIVFAITPLYNVQNPKLFGLTFFYWFETLWLVVTAIFFLAAALLLNKMEGGS
jgi:TRAP-type mannitol/chloroaromatic compound transport system permease small subunit